MRPIIGITTYGRTERPAPTDHYERHFTVPDVYVNSVRRAGGVAVLLPPGETAWDRWLDVVDGVVSTGGTDVDAARYDAVRSEFAQPADSERDESEMVLTRAAVDRGIPSLFVCRGMQMLNVALGGTLHQHIPALGGEDIHRDAAGGWVFHEVNASENSIISSVMGATSVLPCSGHHQALDVVAERLNVVAKAPDGVIEAVEASDHPWCVGVQWHPEVTANDDATQQGLFNGLVAAAKERRRAFAG